MGHCGLFDSFISIQPEVIPQAAVFHFNLDASFHHNQHLSYEPLEKCWQAFL
jgi:hypothetical protein